MKKILLVLICIFFITGCGHVKLSNGENAVVNFKDVEGISSDDLYKKLKEKEGMATLVDLIDAKLLNKLYETTSEEKEYVKNQVEIVKANAENFKVDVDLYLSYQYNVPSLDAYKDQISLTYKRNLWADDYSKESVTEKQINEYYDKYYVGDIEAKHILITVDVDSSATSDEKTEAENKAFDKAVEIINKLKAGESFDDLVKTYSQDTTTSKKNGSLGKINVGDYDNNVFDALKDLEIGKYSTTPVKSTYGYHILYKVSQDEKPELNDKVEEKIRTVVSKEVKNETNFSTKALVELRRKYEMEIIDNELKKSYEKNYSAY